MTENGYTQSANAGGFRQILPYLQPSHLSNWKIPIAHCHWVLFDDFAVSAGSNNRLSHCGIPFFSYLYAVSIRSVEERWRDVGYRLVLHHFIPPFSPFHE